MEVFIQRVQGRTGAGYTRKDLSSGSKDEQEQGIKGLIYPAFIGYEEAGFICLAREKAIKSYLFAFLPR